MVVLVSGESGILTAACEDEMCWEVCLVQMCSVVLPKAWLLGCQQ